MTRTVWLSMDFVAWILCKLQLAMLQDANSGPVQSNLFILISHNMVYGFSECILWKHCDDKILKKMK